jgi:predicted ATPase
MRKLCFTTPRSTFNFVCKDSKMPLRLDSLQIKNYRQLRSLEVASLGQVNLIVGGNNTGKSTLLEAIWLLASRASPSVIAELLVLHDEFQWTANGEAEPVRPIANLFSGRSFPFEDGQAIHVGNASGTLSVQLEHVLLREESEIREMEGRKAEVLRWQSVAKKDRNHLTEVSEAVEVTLVDATLPPGHPIKVRPLTLDAFFSPGRRHLFEEAMPPIPASFVQARFSLKNSLAEDWDAVVLTDGEHDALNALRLIEPDTEGLAFIQQSRYRLARARGDEQQRSPVIRLKGSSAPVPLQSMGDGMTRVLQLTLAALRARNGFLLVDEIENGLHYAVQEKVWRLIFKLAHTNNMQVFATTHSMDCVRAFAKVSAEDGLDGRLLHMERNEDSGQADISTLGEEELSNLLAAGIEVR